MNVTKEALQKALDEAVRAEESEIRDILDELIRQIVDGPDPRQLLVYRKIEAERSKSRVMELVESFIMRAQNAERSEG